MKNFARKENETLITSNDSHQVKGNLNPDFCNKLAEYFKTSPEVIERLCNYSLKRERCIRCGLSSRKPVLWEKDLTVASDILKQLTQVYKQLLENQKPVPPFRKIECDIMFVGEAPGNEEEKQGRPFIHKAGNLLRTTIKKILKEITEELNIRPEDLSIVITNACKCKPVKGSTEDIRPPKKEEIDACRVHLEEEIKLFTPKIIVALGKTAVISLRLKESGKKLEELRGSVFDSPYGKVVVTYHPSAILRNNYKNLKSFEDDIRKAFRLVILESSNRPKDAVILTSFLTTDEELELFEDLIKELISYRKNVLAKPRVTKVAFDYETVFTNWKEFNIDLDLKESGAIDLKKDTKEGFDVNLARAWLDPGSPLSDISYVSFAFDLDRNEYKALKERIDRIFHSPSKTNKDKECTEAETEALTYILSVSFPVRARSQLNRVLDYVEERISVLERDIKSLPQRVIKTLIESDLANRNLLLSLFYLYDEYNLSPNILEEIIELYEKEVRQEVIKAVKVKKDLVEKRKDYAKEVRDNESIDKSLGTENIAFEELFKEDQKMNQRVKILFARLEREIYKLLESCISSYKKIRTNIERVRDQLERLSIDEERAIELLKYFLTSSEFYRIAHNPAFEYAFTKKKLGIEPVIHTGTDILDYLFGNTELKLKKLESKYIDHERVDGFVSKEKALSGASDSIQAFALYNALDSAKTLLIFRKQCEHLIRLSNIKVNNSYTEVGLDSAIRCANEFTMKTIVPLVTEMQINGIRYDIEKARSIADRCTYMITVLKERLEELIGTGDVKTDEFKKRVYALYEGEPIRTAQGEYSVSKDALQVIFKTTSSKELKEVVLSAYSIEKYRTLLNKYVEKFSFFVFKDGRVHPSYRITETASGRLSCEKPNIQQIPREPFKSCPKCFVVPFEGNKCPLCGSDVEVLVDVREAFIADDNHYLIMADYSQIEMMILAELSGDENLISAINQGLDMHSYNASNVYGIPYEEIKAKKDTDPEIARLRQNAKRVTFAVIYGASDEGIAQREDIPKEEASRIIDTFFEKHPLTRKWIENMHLEACTKGVIISPVGRPRWFPRPEIDREVEPDDLIRFVDRSILRRAQNTPIQAYASDINLITCEYLRRLGFKVIGSVHDSIVLEIAEHEPVEEVKQKVEQVIEDIKNVPEVLKRLGLTRLPEIVRPLKVNIKLEAKSGKSWKEVKG